MDIGKPLRGVFLTCALTFTGSGASLAQTWEQVTRPGGITMGNWADPLEVFKSPAQKASEKLEITQFDLAVAKAIHALMQDERNPGKQKAVKDALAQRPGRTPDLNIMIGYDKFTQTGRFFPFDNAENYQKNVIDKLTAREFSERMSAVHMEAASTMRQLTDPSVPDVQTVEQSTIKRDSVAKGRPQLKQDQLRR